MTTRTRYQDWVSYHVLDWQRKLAQAEQDMDRESWLNPLAKQHAQDYLALCRRKLAYWQARVKP